MSCDNPTDCAERDLTADDTKAERAVLAFLLDEYPVQLTIPELSLALNAAQGDFAANDAVERAVRELVGAGLVRCQGAFVVPTRATLYVERLALLG
jgi:hypothetical protein